MCILPSRRGPPVSRGARGHCAPGRRPGAAPRLTRSSAQRKLLQIFAAKGKQQIRNLATAVAEMTQFPRSTAAKNAVDTGACQAPRVLQRIAKVSEAAR